MLFINATYIAPDAREWLENTRRPRILHIFEHVCNLINERSEVLSIVTPQIGNGPFNLVIEENVLFPEHINFQSIISIFSDQLTLGELTIHTANTHLWSPRPNWETLYANKNTIFNSLTNIEIASSGALPQSISTIVLATTLTHLSLTNYQPLISNLSSALANADISSVLNVTSELAGLGAGLTPAGDDFILGAVLAVWIIHPPEVANVLAKEITNNAAPLTTSLSAAWLRSAGRGEVGILWHELFDAVLVGNPSDIQLQITKILSVGDTSGADALAGFIGTLRYWAELANPKIS